MAVLQFEISNAMARLIKAGKAVISSGGVRNTTGQLMELAKPVVSNNLSNLVSPSLGPISAGVNLASSLAGNIQPGLIQHSVNIANAKLDGIIKQLGTLSNALSGLNQIQVLSWVNSAFGLANCGLSIAGFYMTLKKMDGLHGQLTNFFDRYKQDRQSDRIQEYEKILMDLKADLAYINQLHTEKTFDNKVFDVRAAGIEKDLNTARAFLKALMEDFQNRRIDGVMGCEMIFTLMTIYSQLFNEFCCWQYYAHHTHHPLFSDWKIILENVHSPAFQRAVSQFLTFEPSYARISPARKVESHRIIFEGVNQQLSRIHACSEAIENLPIEDFIFIDALMNQRVTEAVATQLLGVEPAELDNMITEKVQKAEIAGDDNDRIALPVFTTG